jgi:hypothetical protein
VAIRNVRLDPKSGHAQLPHQCPLSAKSGHSVQTNNAWRECGICWSALRRDADLAGTFASDCFKHLPNPFAESICNRAQTRLHHLVLLVIAVFVIMYLGLGFVRFSLA